MQRRAALAGLAACAARASSAQDAPALHWRHTGDIGALAWVEASLKGRPFRALLDTGASSAVISPALARALDLERVGSTRVAGLGGVQQVERVQLSELRLGDRLAPTATALVLDLSALLGPALAGLDGLIGMPSLRGAPVTLDFAQGHLRNGALTGTASPLRWDAGLPVIELRLGDRAPAPFLFDTGNAGALVVFEHHARTLLADAPALPQTTVRELGGAVSAHYALFERIDGPGFTARDVPVAFEAGARARRGTHFDRLAGSLGTALFRSASVGLDDSRWTLRHPGLPALPALPGGYGFALDSSSLAVTALIDGGPAARAGLALGSRLASLDGRSTEGGSASDVWRALDGGQAADFEWLRPDTTRQTTRLQRERFFPRLS